MNTIDKFIKEMDLISEKIHKIEKVYEEVYKEYEGNDFEEQNKYASEIDNSILIMTHEIKTILGFEKDRLKKLIIYINFRRKFNDYNDDELAKIIDQFYKINIIEKKNLMKKGNAELIISEWNNLFNSKGYFKIKKELRI